MGREERKTWQGTKEDGKNKGEIQKGEEESGGRKEMRKQEKERKKREEMKGRRKGQMEGGRGRLVLALYGENSIHFKIHRFLPDRE